MKRLGFALKPVPPFRLDLTVWTLRRRPHNIIDRWEDKTYRRVLAIPGGMADVAVTQTRPPEEPRVRVEVEGERLGSEVREAVTSALERLLGLQIDLSPFYLFAGRDPKLEELADRFRGMKPPRYPTVFETLVNGIVCQQVTLSLGIQLLGKLAEACGLAEASAGAGSHAFPRPKELAELPPDTFRQIGLSRQKTRALIELASAVSADTVDLEALVDKPDDVVLERLMQLRGVGRWTAEYAMLRGLGRLHIFPGDDVGGRKNLERWLNLPASLDYEGVRRALERWHAYAGLIYLHLLLERLARAGDISQVP